MMSRSSSSSRVSDDMQSRILSSLPAGCKVLATAAAKVYQKPFSQKPEKESWTYMGLSGTLVFGRSRFSNDADSSIAGSSEIGDLEEAYWFRLVDAVKGVVWMHQIPDHFDYHVDKPFFHMFSGKSRMFGFRFDEDADAGIFLKQVTSEVAVSGSPSKPKRERLPSPKRLLTSMISRPAPGTFVHVAHVGIDADGNNEASGSISPGWIVAFEQLQGGPMHPPPGEAKPVPLGDAVKTGTSSPASTLSKPRRRLTFF